MAKKDAVVLESGEKIESIGPWTIAWRKFKQNRVAMAGLIIFVLIVVAVIVDELLLLLLVDCEIRPVYVAKDGQQTNQK